MKMPYGIWVKIRMKAAILSKKQEPFLIPENLKPKALVYTFLHFYRLHGSAIVKIDPQENVSSFKMRRQQILSINLSFDLFTLKLNFEV